MLEVTATKDYTAASPVPIFACESHCASWARKVRTSLTLTQRELAKRAGVSRGDVDRLENNRPLPADVRYKLLRELWAARSAAAGAWPR